MGARYTEDLGGIHQRAARDAKTPKVKQLVVSQEDSQFQNMAIYTVSNGPEGAAQADAPLRQDVMSPQIPGPVIILDSGELSNLMELSEAEAREENSEGWVAGPKAVTVMRAAGVGWKGVVPKCVLVTTSTTPRGTSCDWCCRMGWTCFSRRKGGQVLGACSWCYKVKTACKTGWWGSLDADTDDRQWRGSSKLGIHGGRKDEDGLAKWSPRLAAMCTQARLETYRM